MRAVRPQRQPGQPAPAALAGMGWVARCAGLGPGAEPADQRAGPGGDRGRRVRRGGIFDFRPGLVDRAAAAPSGADSVRPRGEADPMTPQSRAAVIARRS